MYSGRSWSTLAGSSSSTRNNLPQDLLWIILKALGFFVAAAVVGRTLLPEIINLTTLAKHSSFWTGFALCTALGFAQVASFAGLAPLIGAFVAGLLLDDVHFVCADISRHRLETMLRPITDVLLTIFFVGIGSQVQLESLANPQVLTMVASLTAIAIISKGVVGFAVRKDGYDRSAIGLGMIGRGEVGLVFAAFAFGHGIFSGDTCSALVIVVLLSSMAGPLLLKQRLRNL
jgi:Kef-type K+ transport system membrane component KefB